MIYNEKPFLKQKYPMFITQAEEHIKVLFSGLIELEQNSGTENPTGLIEIIFAEAKRLEKDAHSVHRNDIELICRALENTFAKLKNEKPFLSVSQFDVLHRAIEAISEMAAVDSTNPNSDSAEIINFLNTIAETHQYEKRKEKKTATIKKTIKKAANSSFFNHADVASELLTEETLSQNETLRIAADKLDPLFRQAEQFIQSKSTAALRTSELKNIIDFIDSWKSEIIRYDDRRSKESMHQLKKINDRNNSKLNELEARLNVYTKSAETDQRSLGRMIDEHLESMKYVLMLPANVITEGLPRFVQDLALSQGKDAELILVGTEIEVDKRILEELKDPLIQLIRNCIDHGIKIPFERKQLKKHSRGRVTLSFKNKGNSLLEITVSDDGEGIMPDKVQSAANKAGTIDKNSPLNLNAQETFMLLSQPVSSANNKIRETSGHRSGLAIVREKAENLGGSVSLESRPGIGTTVRIIVPLSLSTFRSVLVRKGEHFLSIPAIHVDRIIRINRGEIKTVEHTGTILCAGEILRIVNLADALGLINEKTSVSAKKHSDAILPKKNIPVLILQHNDKRIAFSVDEIIEECPILVKEVDGRQIRIRNIRGTSLLEHGIEVPVVNVSDLMNSVLRSVIPVKELQKEKFEPANKFKILVIDDSNTTRTLIQKSLESAGYEVLTSVDGIDAYTKIMIGEFNLVVSGIDLPGMNGFELISKIRRDNKYADLPVVLITEPGSEDREQGISPGANTYISKSNSDPRYLLEVINKLL